MLSACITKFLWVDVNKERHQNGPELVFQLNGRENGIQIALLDQKLEKPKISAPGITRRSPIQELSELDVA